LILGEQHVLFGIPPLKAQNAKIFYKLWGTQRLGAPLSAPMPLKFTELHEQKNCYIATSAHSTIDSQCLDGRGFTARICAWTLRYRTVVGTLPTTTEILNNKTILRARIKRAFYQASCHDLFKQKPDKQWRRC